MGCEKLYDMKPRGRKPIITKPHIRAIKTIVESSGFNRFTCKKIKGKLEEDHPNLTKLSLGTINKVIKRYLGYRWRRVGLRDPKVTT